MKPSINKYDHKNFLKLFKYNIVNVKCSHVISSTSFNQICLIKKAISKIMIGVNECYKQLHQTQNNIKNRVKITKIGYITHGNRELWIKKLNIIINGDENNNKLDNQDWICGDFSTTDELFDYLINLPLHKAIEFNTFKLCATKYEEQGPFNELFVLNHYNIMHRVASEF